MYTYSDSFIYMFGVQWKQFGLDTKQNLDLFSPVLQSLTKAEERRESKRKWERRNRQKKIKEKEELEAVSI